MEEWLRLHTLGPAAGYNMDLVLVLPNQLDTL